MTKPGGHFRDADYQRGRVKVEGGGAGAVAHVGLHALGSFADRLSLGPLISAVIPQSAFVGHDRGKVVLQAALTLAGGGECCADIEFLRASSALFGEVCSDSTLYRTVRAITPAGREDLLAAVAPARQQVWSRSSATVGTSPIFLDIDASLVEIHSENKEQAAANYKGGYGFHPMFCFADATGEALSGRLRPGNATANSAADHLAVLDEAVAQLPAAARAGHLAGDDNLLARLNIVLRTDSAGCSKSLMAGLSARNIGFMVVARRREEIGAAIFDAEGLEEVWVPAICQDGTAKEGSSVAELTSLVDTSAFGENIRFIVRREPLHPGAQTSLFPSLDYRYWGFYTDQDGDPAELDRLMRAHAHCEAGIERLKESGLCRFPFTSFEANANWMAIVLLAHDLVRWFQLLCLQGRYASAAPKALRWSVFHAPGRLVYSARSSIVRILEQWPSAQAILRAYEQMALIT